MKHIKFSKTLCGVDFLLNVIDLDSSTVSSLSEELHTADFFQVVFVKNGSGAVVLDGQKIDLRANRVLFISQHQKYQWQVDTNNFEATFLVFQEDFLNDFFADQYFTYRLLYFYQNELPLFLDLTSYAIIQHAEQLSEIKQELTKPLSDSVHLIRSILYYLLAKLNRSYSKHHEFADSGSTESTAFQFRKLAEKHIRTCQRVEDYTDLMKVSRITLNKLVKRQFNQTVSDFLKSRLLHEIKMELIYTNKTIDQLAIDFNFSEPNHLSRFFKTQTRSTPTEFRHDYQNGSLS
ncbi:AraC family transcriptional regulator [Prolixibacteraceae bacterium JC049]|nr:AraC family transcriptional regulator [Prolixibacteraceae bacterium JC049]